MHVVDGMQVFELSGSLDIATSPTVRASLLDASARGDHRLIVDLTNVDFLDSTGLGALIGAQRRAKEFDGEVRLVVKEGQIVRLLRITGLLKIFAVYSRSTMPSTTGRASATCDRRRLRADVRPLASR